MRGDLAWTLRRHRAGALGSSRVRQAFESQLHRLIELRALLQPEIDELRRVASERLTSFDVATDGVLQWLAEERFDLALRDLRTAAGDQAEMRRMVDAVVAWRMASASLARVEDLVTEDLGAPATLRILWRLRDRARCFLDAGRARESQFVVLLLTQQIGLLTARPAGDDLTSREAVGADLEALDRRAADGLRRLARGGHHFLAKRLAEDLLADLEVGDRARRALQTEGPLASIRGQLASVRRDAQAVQASVERWLEQAG